MTKDDARADGACTNPGNQLSTTNRQRPDVAASRGLRKHPFRIKSFVVARVITPCEIVHQLLYASNTNLFSSHALLSDTNATSDTSDINDTSDQR
jgi:hypothetical protein